MKVRRGLIIASIVLSIVGIVFWLTLPAFYTINDVNGKIRTTVSGIATIFGGDIVMKGSGLSTKVLNASPMLIIALVLAIAGVVLSIVRLTVKKNMLLAILTALCFLAAAVFIALTKQVIVTIDILNKDNFVKNLKMMGPIFAAPFLFAAAITSIVKTK